MAEEKYAFTFNPIALKTTKTLSFNPITLRTAKTLCFIHIALRTAKTQKSFGRFESNMVKVKTKRKVKLKIYLLI